MKTRILNTFAPAVLVLMCYTLLVSCRSEEPLTGKHNMFYEGATKKSFSLEDQTQLNALITVLAKEPNGIEIVEDASVVDLTDSRGDFRAISVQYRAGDRIIKMIVPIVKDQDTYTLSEENCNMKCIARVPCTECNLEIIERCKTLTGSYSGEGSCSTSVAFNDSAVKNTILHAR
jgi:hypothetical protein